MPTITVPSVRTSQSAARLACSGCRRTWTTSAATHAASTANQARCSPPPNASTTSHGTVKSAAAARAAAPQRSRVLGRGGSRLVNRRAAAVALDELLHELVRLVVLDLLRRRLHQVRARLDERARDAVVQGELRKPHRVDDDAR